MCGSRNHRDHPLVLGDRPLELVGSLSECHSFDFSRTHLSCRLVLAARRTATETSRHCLTDPRHRVGMPVVNYSSPQERARPFSLGF